VVLGTDTPFGAIAYHRELRHLRSAGLTSWDVLDAATRRGAQALRRDDLGELAAGGLPTSSSSTVTRCGP